MNYFKTFYLFKVNFSLLFYLKRNLLQTIGIVKILSITLHTEKKQENYFHKVQNNVNRGSFLPLTSKKYHNATS